MRSKCLRTIGISVAAMGLAVLTTAATADEVAPPAIPAIPPAPAIIIESGDFIQEVERLKDLAIALEDLAIAKGSDPYIPPTSQELNAFAILAATLLSGSISIVLPQADALGYEVVKFTDTVSSEVYVGLGKQDRNLFQRYIQTNIMFHGRSPQRFFVKEVDLI